MIRTTRRTARGRCRTPSVLALLACMGVITSCTAAGSQEEALRRGDQAFARGDLTEALAEYRLALAQGDESLEALLRVAHTYARTGRISEAREYYGQVVALQPDMADLAAADLLAVARAAMESGDGVAAAAAVEGAAALRPGVSPTGISLLLARHFTRNGRPDQSVPFFQKALRESEAETDVTFEMALAHEEMGDCRRALVFFEQIRRDVTPAQRSEVDWNIGNCSADLAEEAEVDEDLGEALRLYRVTISIGEPRDRLGEAWFQVGEILSARGECQAAVEAFEQVRRQELSGGLLADRARARIDDIRFGRGC